MFLDDKYSASGVFEKIKAKFLAGVNQQNKGLYEDLIADCCHDILVSYNSNRKVIVIVVGGASLNADMALTGIASCHRCLRNLIHVSGDMDYNWHYTGLRRHDVRFHVRR